MPQRGDVSALRWLVGNELRSARLAAGKTQAQAGAVLGSSHAKINYLEIGRNLQQPAEIETLLRFYGGSDDDVHRLVSLASRTDDVLLSLVSSDAVPDWTRIFIGLEKLASREFMYVPLIIPGLLQTPLYVSGILADDLRVSAADIGRVVRSREERQRRLTETRDILQFSTVIDDVALDRMVGGVDGMREQLQHLLDLSSRANITIQVMPLSVPVHPGIDGQFATLEFDEARTVGYAEIPGGAVYLQDPDKIDEYVLAAKRISSAALSADDSIELIRERLKRLT